MLESIIATIFFIASANHSPGTTQVILLPNADGHTSVLEVITAQQTVVIDKPFQMVEVVPNRKPEIKAIEPKAVQKQFVDVLQDAPPLEETYILYFESDQTMLTKQSFKMLHELVQKAKARKNSSLLVLGQGALQGSTPRSLERALALKSMMIDLGLAPQSIITLGRDENASRSPSDKQNLNGQSGDHVQVILR